MSRTRAFTFTINNYTNDDVLMLLELESVYTCFGFEVGSKGTHHIQGYVYFKDGRTIKSLSKQLRRAHIESARGTVKENQVYTSKDGDDMWYSWGEPPSQGLCKWEQIVDVMNDPTSNPHLYNQYHKTYRQITMGKPKDHIRKLYLVSQSIIYKLLNGEQACFDSDHYDGERILVVGGYFEHTLIERWINGYPPKIKRGYELITMDPEIVYILFTDDNDLAKYQSMYEDHIEDVYVILPKDIEII